MDILSGGSNEVEPAYDRTTAGQGAMLANKIAGPPSIKERLEHEIAVTEKRLAAMKAGLEVIENAPALETLQQALAAMNRHNY